MSLSRTTSPRTPIAVAAGSVLYQACAPTSSNAGIGAAADAPSRVYVAPGPTMTTTPSCRAASAGRSPFMDCRPAGC